MSRPLETWDSRTQPLDLDHLPTLDIPFPGPRIRTWGTRHPAFALYLVRALSGARQVANMYLHKKICLKLLVILILTMAVVASSQNIATLKERVADGDANAQTNLADAYAFGKGVPQDYTQAAVWYRKAAEQGDAGAQYNLGVLYDGGLGLPQEHAQAAVWYRKAADQGDADAQINLGALYERGQGVPQDYAQAAVWYRKAADQGDAVAQLDLGLLYSSGQGVPRDYAQAVLWYDKAAVQGNANAQNDLGVLYLNGRGVPQDETQARIWFRKAADQGLAVAKGNLVLPAPAPYRTTGVAEALEALAGKMAVLAIVVLCIWEITGLRARKKRDAETKGGNGGAV